MVMNGENHSIVNTQNSQHIRIMSKMCSKRHNDNNMVCVWSGFCVAGHLFDIMSRIFLVLWRVKSEVVVGFFSLAVWFFFVIDSKRALNKKHFDGKVLMNINSFKYFILNTDMNFSIFMRYVRVSVSICVCLTGGGESSSSRPNVRVVDKQANAQEWCDNFSFFLSFCTIV